MKVNILLLKSGFKSLLPDAVKVKSPSEARTGRPAWISKWRLCDRVTCTVKEIPALGEAGQHLLGCQSRSVTGQHVGPSMVTAGPSGPS